MKCPRCNYVSFDSMPQCKKCGEYRMDWKLWVDEVTSFGSKDRTWVGDPYLLEVKCQRCGHRWMMRSLDYKGE